MEKIIKIVNLILIQNVLSFEKFSSLTFKTFMT